MSINLSVTISLETIALIHQSEIVLEEARTEFEAALADVASSVIEAVKALPYDITISDSDYPGPCRSRPPSLRHSVQPSIQDHDSSYAESPPTTFPSTPVICSGSWSSLPAYDPQNGEEDFTINVSDLEGLQTTFCVSVFGSTTISELADMVHDQSGIPPDQQRLIWRNHRLDQPDATLSSYGIASGEDLYLLRQLLPSPDMTAANDGIFFPESEFDFHIQTISGKQIPVAARYSTTTAELASAIFDYNCIPPNLQRLIHKGRVIYDGHSHEQGNAFPVFTLEEVNVAHDSVVQLYFCNTMRDF
ncbi:Polyubiquitin [Fulvia fulva]|uniref:Polyubiquitin n=1 Tax=Passalora fulva TaxID=5499 RepID=A0A9Q8P6X9_PASFU|nr:Polyubiquitin [Fulvia fulva]KAK4629623.1 Polyubiquitin [Fulvia fulva]KAK4629866.1 Polyubiquitin [Fulvia fulva]UJO15600.1 Polyubiquitin [Fulvia fulva]WPV12094.1 Polyubiquitin [Fulvia fulva]WPV27453.1 Polyubiquitin [Fulvia fulva]